LKKFLLYLTLAFLLAGCQQSPPQRSGPDWSLYRKAYSLLQVKPDSAFFYFNQVAVQSRDSLQIAMAYSAMGQIQYRAGDYYGSQESLLNSLKYLRESNQTHHVYIAGDYNDLGLARSELKDRDGALSFYGQALRFDPDSNLLNQVWNNMAYEWQQKGKYKEAAALYRRLLEKIKTRNPDYARALTNLAITRWLADPGFHAAAPLREALAIRKRSGDLWGQNSSYSHLTDYYRRPRPDSALLFAKAMYTVSRQIQSPDEQIEALSRLIYLSPAVDAKSYFSRFRRLNDSVQTARNAAKNQFALIRYNVDKAKAENLTLQKDNADKKLQLIKQSIRFYGALVVFLLAAGFSVLWYRKRKRQQELDKQNAVIETRQKDAKKVHDTLANDIYRIMKRVQHDPAVDKVWLEDNIDEVYQLARDLSYEINTDADEYFTEKIDELLTGFATDATAVVLVGNEKEFWQQLPAAFKPELKYVLQELMVNMQKHSLATNVLVKFSQQEGCYMITYFDDGVGFKEGHAPNNGLKNTGNRINAIGGEIKFVSSAGKGLEIQITFRLLKS
jgi:signal transduction histidine kinase